MKAAVDKCPDRRPTLNGQCPAPLSPFSLLQKTGFEIAKSMFVLPPQLRFQEDRGRDFSFLLRHPIAQHLGNAQVDCIIHFEMYHMYFFPFLSFH